MERKISKMEKQTLGKMISTLRKQKNMTQMQLAQQMGVTDKAVSKWERDLAYPDISSFPKLAEILGISIDELLNSNVNTDKTNNDQWQRILLLILKVIPLAMGVSIFVLSLLDQIDNKSGLALLGIGMYCLASERLSSNKDH